MQANPLAAPLAERGADGIRLAVERALRAQATPGWTEEALARAVAAGDADRAAMLLGLADDLDVPLAPEARARAEAPLAGDGGWAARTGDCLICMADVARCPSLRLVAACALPFEMTPLGDANALRRQGMAWAMGDEVDRLEAGLALVGLGATGAAVLTGGTSLTVKAGAGLLRMARRMGSLTPGLTRALALPGEGARLGAGRAEGPSDAARVVLATGVAADLGRLRAAVGTAEALRLMRVVEGPQDAARLARLAGALGPDTRRAVDLLGPGRALRLTVRLSDAALGAAALIGALLMQLAGWAGARLGAGLLRGLAPGLRGAAAAV
jgi:hypothetical protein